MAAPATPMLWRPTLSQRVWRLARALAIGARLGTLGRWSRQSMVDPKGMAAVSVTTHGARTARVHLTLESIARGTERPTRLLLWLDDPAAFAALPEPLRRAQRRGLEVRLTENYGPHTKYFPAVMDPTVADGLPLVTADDDIFYPPTMLRALLEAWRAEPSHNVVHRAHEVTLQGERVAPYARWHACTSAAASPLNFPTGVAGALYTPAMQAALRERGDAFQSVCPTNDDMWLHVVALRSGIPVRQVAALPARSLPIAMSQRKGLHLLNGGQQQAGNDAQIAVTYTEADIALLIAGGAAQCDAPVPPEGSPRP